MLGLDGLYLLSVTASTDFTWLTTLISTLGFPIICCIACFFVIMKMNEQHKEEVEKFTEALNKNTVALTGLVQSIDALQNMILKGE